MSKGFIEYENQYGSVNLSAAHINHWVVKVKYNFELKKTEFISKVHLMVVLRVRFKYVYQLEFEILGGFSVWLRAV